MCLLFFPTENNGTPKLFPTENAKVDNGANCTMPQINLEDLSNIKQLEALFRAETIMALFSGHSSSHQQHCLMAYACIVRIWQVRLYEIMCRVTIMWPIYFMSPCVIVVFSSYSFGV